MTKNIKFSVLFRVVHHVLNSCGKNNHYKLQA